jgi:hypothetical protein
MTDNEYGVLLRHAHKFCGHAAAGSGQSANHILHGETPLFKNRNDVMGNFKNLRGVGIP